MDKKEPIPVRNIRIPDPLWYRLEALAQKRSVSRTTLLIEGIHLVLAAGEGEGSTLASPLTQSVIVKAPSNAELKRQLKKLAEDFQALEDHVNATEAQVQAELHTYVDALEERIKALENKYKLGTEQVLNENVPLTSTEPEDSHKLGTEKVQVADDSSSVDAPLTQGKLATRLSLSDKAVEKARRKGAEYFASWSQGRDPDGRAWTWKGHGGRGQPLRYVPLG